MPFTVLDVCKGLPVSCMQTVQLLLKHGASVSLPNQYASSPMHRAAAMGHVTIVQMLLEAGGDVNAVAERPPPVDPSKLAAAAALDANDATANGGPPAPPGPKPVTPGNTAPISKRAASLVRTKSRHVIQDRSKPGWTSGLPTIKSLSVLAAAAEAGHKPLVEMLLAWSAKFDLLCLDDQDTLHMVLERGHADVFSLLIQHAKQAAGKGQGQGTTAATAGQPGQLTRRIGSTTSAATAGNKQPASDVVARVRRNGSGGGSKNGSEGNVKGSKSSSSNGTKGSSQGTNNNNTSLKHSDNMSAALSGQHTHSSSSTTGKQALAASAGKIDATILASPSSMNGQKASQDSATGTSVPEAADSAGAVSCTVSHLDGLGCDDHCVDADAAAVVTVAASAVSATCSEQPEPAAAASSTDGAQQSPTERSAPAAVQEAKHAGEQLRQLIAREREQLRQSKGMLLALEQAEEDAQADTDHVKDTGDTPLERCCLSLGGLEVSCSCNHEADGYMVLSSQRRMHLDCSCGCSVVFHLECWTVLEEQLRDSSKAAEAEQPCSTPRSPFQSFKSGRLHACVTPGCCGIVTAANILEGAVGQERYRYEVYSASQDLIQQHLVQLKADNAKLRARRATIHMTELQKQRWAVKQQLRQLQVQMRSAVTNNQGRSCARNTCGRAGRRRARNKTAHLNAEAAAAAARIAAAAVASVVAAYEAAQREALAAVKAAAVAAVEAEAARQATEQQELLRQQEMQAAQEAMHSNSSSSSSSSPTADTVAAAVIEQEGICSSELGSVMQASAESSTSVSCSSQSPQLPDSQVTQSCAADQTKAAASKPPSAAPRPEIKIISVAKRQQAPVISRKNSLDVQTAISNKDNVQQASAVAHVGSTGRNRPGQQHIAAAHEQRMSADELQFSRGGQLKQHVLAQPAVSKPAAWTPQVSMEWQPRQQHGQVQSGAAAAAAAAVATEVATAGLLPARVPSTPFQRTSTCATASSRRDSTTPGLTATAAATLPCCATAVPPIHVVTLPPNALVATLHQQSDSASQGGVSTPVSLNSSQQAVFSEHDDDSGWDELSGLIDACRLPVHEGLDSTAGAGAGDSWRGRVDALPAMGLPSLQAGLQPAVERGATLPVALLRSSVAAAAVAPQPHLSLGQSLGCSLTGYSPQPTAVDVIAAAANCVPAGSSHTCQLAQLNGNGWSTDYMFDQRSEASSADSHHMSGLGTPSDAGVTSLSQTIEWVEDDTSTGKPVSQAAADTTEAVAAAAASAWPTGSFGGWGNAPVASCGSSSSSYLPLFGATSQGLGSGALLCSWVSGGLPRTSPPLTTDDITQHDGSTPWGCSTAAAAASGNSNSGLLEDVATANYSSSNCSKEPGASHAPLAMNVWDSLYASNPWQAGLGLVSVASAAGSLEQYSFDVQVGFGCSSSAVPLKEASVGVSQAPGLGLTCSSSNFGHQYLDRQEYEEAGGEVAYSAAVQVLSALEA